MGYARCKTIIEGERGVYHCIARCVRRAFLCGLDAYSGRSYEHRRKWVQDRLRKMSQLFAIDVLAYSVMTNHWHVVLRNRPDQLAELSDEDVVRRWEQISAKKRAGTKQDKRRAIECEVMSILSDTNRVKELRNRLGSISWLMKSMNEYISRRSNREDDVSGHFWEGRFRCQRLMDSASILACMVYVDLNPVRAKIAESLQDSEFTSAYDRVNSYVATRCTSKLPESMQASTVEEIKVEIKDVSVTSWLADLDDADTPVFGLSERTYLKLLDITGRCIHAGKEGVLSRDALPILESLELDADEWVKNIMRYGSLFYRVVGRLEHLVDVAKETGMHWLKGRQGSEALFRAPPG